MSSFSLLLEWLEIPPWFSILSIILGFSSFVWGIYSYLKSRRVKSPCYAVRSFNIISKISKIKELEIFYSGQAIENLTATKIMFWNAGRETINSQDIPDADPITVYAKEGHKILVASVLQVKKDANMFSIPVCDQSHVQLHFDYVDKDEGAVIQIFHTGKSSEDIEIRGTVKGAERLREIVPVPISRWLVVLGVGRWLFVALLVAFAMAVIFSPTIQKETTYPILVILLASITTVIMISEVKSGLSDILRRRIPKGFDAFKEEF